MIAAFSISALLEERNKFVMEHIQGWMRLGSQTQIRFGNWIDMKVTAV